MTRRILYILCLLILLINGIASADSLDFTEAERDFISAHPEIKVGVDPHFLPFEFIDTDGSYKGIAADYIKLIEERTGLKFVIMEGLTWSDAYEMAVEKKLDILPCVSKTETRQLYFDFSDGYYQFERVIVMQNAVNDTKGLSDLLGSAVAVQSNSSHHSFLNQYPEINLQLYTTAEEALYAVSKGEVPYYVGNLATTSYLINELGINEMKFVTLDSGERNELHFAIRKDWPELTSILNKTLASITEEERIHIYNKWIGVKESKDYTALFRAIAIVSSVLILTAAVSTYWITKLRGEIEKRKQIEESLRVAKLEAELANEVKGNFLARMSHEIRTPLNAITGLSYLILNSELTHSQRAHMERIKFASETMLSIINDILDFSKLEAGKVEIEHEPFELDEVVRNTINIAGHRIADKNLNLTLIKNPNIPNCFFGDKVRLGQILLNLMVNAIKFTEKGDVVLEMDLYGHERDQYQLEFKVSDTGIGMSKDHLDQLFEPFTQEDASITRRFGGTGLGLSIVKNLVELMNGSISVESTPSQGTTFTINIRLQLDVENERRVNAGFEYIKDIKTLILNKNMSSLSTMVEYLKSFSINPEFTSSEDQFANIIQSNEKKFLKPYDLIIVFDDSTSQGCMKLFEKLTGDTALNQLPKALFIFKYSKENQAETLGPNQYAMYEPYLPSMLYNAISSLFKNKLMASQTEKLDLRSSETTTRYSGDILIVEDNQTNVLIASELLKTLGFDIHTAANGQIAVDMFEEGARFDLVLMDLHMPVLNGYEASKRIRGYSDLPIIAMTADAIAGVKENCTAAGMSDFISKPFDPEKFMAKVKSYFSADPTISDPVEGLPASAEPEPVIDRRLGLKLMGGNEALYQQILMVFAEENTTTLPRIKDALSEKDYKTARDILHKVKSSAGSIGSESVRLLAATLQDLCDEEDTVGIDKLIHPFEDQFSALLKALQTGLEQET